MKQKLLLPILLLTWALVVAACGDSDSSSNRHPISAINVAVSKAAEAKSYKFDGVLKMESLDGAEDESFEMKIEGQTYVDGSKNWMKVDMGALFGAFGATDGDWVMETRVVDGNAYVSSPNIMTGSTDWTKSTFEEYLDESEVLNPADALAHLRAVSEDVENLGKEKVNDEDTTKYQATITKEDLQRYVESDEAQEYFEKFNIDKETYKTDFVDGFEDDVTTTVWINNDDYVSRIQMESVTNNSLIEGQEAEEPVRITITMNFSEWGEDFDVEVPEVTEPGIDDMVLPNPDDFNMEELEQLGSRLEDLQM